MNPTAGEDVRVLTRGREHYDAIVVGAGPAGTAAAYTLARAGHEVALLERGPRPGTKTVMGGAVWTAELRNLFPSFPRGAPVERPVTRLTWHIAGANSSLVMGFDSGKLALEPDRYVVSRARFDPWMVEQAVKAGATLLTSALADDLVWDRGYVVGVRLFPGARALRAPVTVIAEGVWPQLGIRAGLVDSVDASDYSLLVMEVRSLAAAEIESRFGLDPGEGAAVAILGAPTLGLIGTAGMFTWREHVALITGASLRQMARSGIGPRQLLERALDNPEVKRCLNGTRAVEHKANLVAVGGCSAIPRLAGNGVMIAGAAAQMVVGRQGHNNAMRAGRLAAETAIEAARAGDYSARFLSRYRQKVMDSALGQNLAKTRRRASLYTAQRDLYAVYPEMANVIMHRLIIEDGTSLSSKRWRALAAGLSRQSPLKTAGSALAALWALS